MTCGGGAYPPFDPRYITIATNLKSEHPFINLGTLAKASSVACNLIEDGEDDGTRADDPSLFAT